MNHDFIEIISIIKESRTNALRSVNAELIQLYWRLGEYIAIKLEKAEWGSSVVSQLSVHIQKSLPNWKGFSNKNLWRMKQFFETYRHHSKLSPLVREISWSNNVLIFSRCSTYDEKEFYLHRAYSVNYSKRELDRQISARLYERTSIGVLLCKDQDNEVVEYALSRSLSPTMIAEYKTQLPDKQLLIKKLKEL